MGLICKNCHTYNSGTEKHCRKCKNFLVLGENLKRCVYCNFINPKGVKRCIKCGKKFGFFSGVEAEITKTVNSFNPSQTISQKKINKRNVKIQPKNKQNIKTGIVWKDILGEFQKLSTANSKQSVKIVKQPSIQTGSKNVTKIVKYIIWIYVIMMAVGLFADIGKEIFNNNSTNLVKEIKKQTPISVVDKNVINTPSDIKENKNAKIIKTIIVDDSNSTINELKWSQNNIFNYTVRRKDNSLQDKHYSYNLTIMLQAELEKRNNIPTDAIVSLDKSKSVQLNRTIDNKASIQINTYVNEVMSDAENLDLGSFFNSRDVVFFNNFHWLNNEDIVFQAYWNKNNVQWSELFIRYASGSVIQLTGMKDVRSFIQNVAYGKDMITFGVADNANAFETRLIDVSDYQNKTWSKRFLSDYALMDPEFSPNDNRLAFWRYVKNRHVLTIIDVNTKKQKDIFSLDLGVIGDTIRWSPDGKYIAFVVKESNKIDKIHIIEYEGF